MGGVGAAAAGASEHASFWWRASPSAGSSLRGCHLPRATHGLPMASPGSDRIGRALDGA